MTLATRSPVLCEFISTFSHVDLRFVSKNAPEHDIACRAVALAKAD
jgi:hypothetical protein